MRILSPSNLVVDFSCSLRPGEHIPMLYHEVLDAFLRSGAQSRGAPLLPGLFTSLETPSSLSSSELYLIHYTSSPTPGALAGTPSTLAGGALAGTPSTLTIDVVIGTDGANSHVARSITIGTYSLAITFQKRIRLPSEKMAHYEDLTEMYVDSDISPDFYRWVFPSVITWWLASAR
ncbi:putative Geranylgeranyl diphosphate reductase, chloroplastic [Cocos nucifera]|uniref:Putative Geranylgeranyl diphosphate reductase, chloroplastic n=1 Tax=Cocos nucifera TaxID=13894 RepID=A0A8K0MY98_COCNU|nr:putative Geranylgeranyl diphosphate reductase, chloroplastic [Cocos nucifera]